PKDRQPSPPRAALVKGATVSPRSRGERDRNAGSKAPGGGGGGEGPHAGGLQREAGQERVPALIRGGGGVGGRQEDVGVGVGGGEGHGTSVAHGHLCEDVHRGHGDIERHAGHDCVRGGEDESAGAGLVGADVDAAGADHAALVGGGDVWAAGAGVNGRP